MVSIVMNRGRIRRWLLLVTLLAGCSGATGTRLPLVEKASTGGQGRPVILIHGLDQTGGYSLFQLGEDDEQPTVVAGTDGVEVDSVTVSAGGTALAWVAEQDDVRETRSVLLRSPRKLRRLRPSSLQGWPGGKGGWAVKGISDDGDTLVWERGSTIMAARLSSGRAVTVSAKHLGRLWRAPALSADGSAYAFTTIVPSCAGGGYLSQCPIGLHLADLSGLASSPPGITLRPIVPDGLSQAAYNPRFADRGGRKIIYVTNKADRSSDCIAYWDRCAYSLNQVTLDGGKLREEVLVRGTITGSVAADGTLAYGRRPRGKGWQRHVLFIKTGSGPGLRVARGLADRYHHWSPDSRLLLVQRQQGYATVYSVIDRVGQVAWSTATSGWPHHDAVGWVIGRLPRGRGRLRQPESVRQVNAALTRLARLPSRPKVGVHGLTSLAHAAARGRTRAFERLYELEMWVRGGKDRVGLVKRESYCALEKEGLTVRFTVENTLVAFGASVGRSGGPAWAPKTSLLATFETGRLGGVRIDLMGFKMPAEVRIGERFAMEMIWSLSSAPPPDWKVFVHFDHGDRRFQSDHVVSLCGLSGILTGATTRDRFDVWVDPTRAEPGEYTVHTGWWNGPTRARLKGTARKDNENRYVLGRIRVLPMATR